MSSSSSSSDSSSSSSENEAPNEGAPAKVAEVPADVPEKEKSASPAPENATVSSPKPESIGQKSPENDIESPSEGNKEVEKDVEAEEESTNLQEPVAEPQIEPQPTEKPSNLDDVFGSGSSSDEGPINKKTKSNVQPTKSATSSDSEGETVNKTAGRVRNPSSENLLTDSDIDAGTKPKKVTNMTQEDIFGDADMSDSSGDEKEKKVRKDSSGASSGDEGPKRKTVENDSENEENRAQDLDDLEPEPEPEIPETIIKMEVPKMDFHLDSKQIYFARLPNFLSMECRKFDPETYEDENEDEETMDEEGNSRLKLKCENTIRWRKICDENGIELTESNARIIRWSDGSMSLYLGKEMFDVQVQPMFDANSHLYIRQTSGLQGVAVFEQKMTLRPHSTESQTHRKMTLSLADRVQSKQARTKIFTDFGGQKDPEKAKMELIRREEERLRASQRRESMVRRQRERSAYGMGYGSGGMTSSYLESDLGHAGSEGEADVSLSGLKQSYRPGGRDYGRFARNAADDDSDNAESNSDKSENDTANAAGNRSKVKRIDSDSENGDLSADGETKNADDDKQIDDEKDKRKKVIDDDEDEDA